MHELLLRVGIPSERVRFLDPQAPLGARPLSFQERPGLRNPLDFLDSAVRHGDSMDEHPTQLLAAFRGRDGDRIGQREDPGSMGIEGDDAVTIWQYGHRCPSGVTLGSVQVIGDVAPGVLAVPEPRRDPACAR